MPLSNENVPVITLDGPSGSGKGTIATLLAQQLGWRVLDSGAIYRSLAWLALQKQQAEAPFLVELARQMSLVMEHDQVVVNGVTVTTAIRTPEVTAFSSKIAALAEVREALIPLQRAQRKLPGLIADGRDMGTVIFSDATLKIFLTASEDERVQRRYQQIREVSGLSYEEVKAELLKRDQRDAERSASPLKAAPDAFIIDTTEMTPDLVCREILQHLKEK